MTSWPSVTDDYVESVVRSSRRRFLFGGTSQQAMSIQIWTPHISGNAIGDFFQPGSTGSRIVMDIREIRQGSCWVPVFGVRPNGPSCVLPPYGISYHATNDEASGYKSISGFLGKEVKFGTPPAESPCDFEVVSSGSGTFDSEDFVAFLRRVSTNTPEIVTAANDSVPNEAEGVKSSWIGFAKPLISAMEFVNAALLTLDFPDNLEPVNYGEARNGRLLVVETVDDDLVVLQIEVQSSGSSEWRTWGDVGSVEDGQETASQFVNRCDVIRIELQD